MVLRTSPRHASRGPADSRHPSWSGRDYWLPPRRIRWRSRWPSSLLAALVIGWPWLSGRVTIPWDAKAHFQPQIQFLAQSLARGESPFWAPFVFSGHPQIADPQSMIFSPPFLAAGAARTRAPSLWAVDATVLAMVFLGGAALMLWFRDQGWHWAGGLIAALAFCYGASMAWRIQHIGQVLSLAYLPIAMLCLDRALARGSIVYGVAAGVVAACIVLGRDQVALLGDLFAGGASRSGASSRRTEPRLRCAQACCRWRPGASARLVAHRRAGPADRPAGRRNPTGPSIDYIGAGARLAASGPAADARDARRVRRLGPHGGLLGPAELRLARYRHLHRPEHGPALHRRHPAPAAADGRRARPAVGAGDPLLHLSPPASRCSTRSAGTRPSSASSTRWCRASASIAGRRTRRS